MFDRLAWRRECYERYLLGLDDEDDEEEHDGELLPLPDGEALFHSWTS
jgi:hypothetical protein